MGTKGSLVPTSEGDLLETPCIPVILLWAWH